MPILENAKHEKMVQLKVKGYSQRQAYKKVYDNNMTDEQIDKILKYYMGKNTMERQRFIMENLIVEEYTPVE